MNIKPNKGLRRPNRRGATALEFAFTVIPLFVIILGSMEYAWYFCNILVLDEVVQVVSDDAAIHLVNDINDDHTVGRTWESHGIDHWNYYGLPGEPTFQTTVLTSSGVYLVHVTGTLPGYSGLVDTFYGLTGLPTTVEVTVARRIEEQELGGDILALF